MTFRWANRTTRTYSFPTIMDVWTDILRLALERIPRLVT